MWFLGIDIGTTHIKIIGLSEDGVLLPVKKCRTPILQRDGLTFHDAQDVWQMLVIQLTDYARTAARAHGPLAAISIGTFGQEESVAVNLRGDIVYPSLAWWENYPAAALDNETQSWLDSEEHYAISGMRSRPNQSPERLSWIRQHHEELWNHIDLWVDFGTFIMWRLTGEWRAPSSQLTHSQCIDLKSMQPHEPTLQQLRLSPTLFPTPADTGECCGEIHAQMLPGVELYPGACVFIGGHDQIVGALAVQHNQPTHVFDSIGTSEYLMVLTPHFPDTSAAWQLGVDIERTWKAGEFVMGCATPSGKIIQTLAELLYQGDYDHLFNDLLTDADTRGVSVSVDESEAQGLFSLHHLNAGIRPAGLVQATLNHIADRAYQLLTQMCEMGAIRPQDAVLMGSLFQRSEMIEHRKRRWKMPLFASTLTEPVAMGAAMIARESWFIATHREDQL
ncbi:TPA: carbohydrate kinase [Raoultella ornithinolytica]|uniref:FGGY family carbohydrate kinase n=1 Tax=Raoultella ornithinolytica TaxID=54291 RepID=UPI001A29EE79|nr:carbohydrate kinase [Raoultella ornithinolytica]HAT3824809.1 carbohydrate kinase [Raoultella ornithinolytica]HEQ2050689.1 carbohydrate kinase [Raoultella ornithinolytica]